MMPTSARVQHTDEGVVRVRLWGEKLVVVVPSDRWENGRQLTRRIVREPFTRQAWNELFYLVVGSPLAGVALGLLALTMVGGLILAITFFGLAVVVLSLRLARGFGGFQRGLARGLLHQGINDPDPFAPRPGFFGWLQAGLRDRTAWRAIAYFFVKVPLSIAGVYVAFSLWWNAFVCLLQPILSSRTESPAEFGFVRNAFEPGYFSVGTSGFFHNIAIFITGLFLLLLAPWAVRGFVAIDTRLMRTLLAPDSMVERLRTLEQARTQTVDASAATLRRIERDLHDGTQAQLVALAMRLGMAKEKLETGEPLDLAQARELIDTAHQGAKEAIAELRDLARGIHPPALDVGLEGALATLAARNTIPTECTVTLQDRPTPAIESIAYFCVAELLANVAQHANASRATITASQSGQWLRLVVRDDGVGGAQLSTQGTSSSGLAGLTDRVHAVDGRLQIVSPLGGPTVVTVDLPLHA